MREIDETYAPTRKVELAVGDVLMRSLQERAQEAELPHQLQGRRMDGVSAKITQEVRRFLEHDDLDACTGEQEATHHAGGPATGDQTGGRLRLHDRSPDVQRPFAHAPKRSRRKLTRESAIAIS